MRHRLDPEWTGVEERCGAIWVLLEECRLDLNAVRVARKLGHRDAASLQRSLRAKNLPPFSALRDWVYVVLLLNHAEHDTSLAHLVLGRGEDPAMYYRFIARVTGRSWTELRGLGIAWALASVHPETLTEQL